MKLLRLANTLNQTSAPFNQFALGFKESIDQTYCSLNKNDVSAKEGLTIVHANGSILGLIKLIRNLLIKNNYDIVHIHSGVTGIAFLIALFPLRFSLLKKTVFTLHNSWGVLKLRNQILNIIVMFVVEKVCTCGQASKDSIPNKINFFIDHKTTAIINCFDNRRIDDVKDNKTAVKHFNSTSKIKILCVGALNHTKNQIALLEVFKEINIESEIIFLGDGINKSNLINFSKGLTNFDDISFKGRVSRNLTIEHMLEADISISLSKGEGLPIAVLESMYAGCFLILSSIPPHKEISPPRNRCIFVNSSKKREILNSLNFVNNNISTIRQERLSSREYAIDRFGLKNMLEKYKNVYDCLDKKKIILDN
jgi:glycosyltransferase involved in cell wall biosynthesis